MIKKRHFLTLILITTFISASCSDFKGINHKSEKAFLDWWKKGHCIEGVDVPLDFSNKIYIKSKINNSPVKLGGTEEYYEILKWNKTEWILVLSQGQNESTKHRSWIVQLPDNIWIALGPRLSYELCTASSKYSDLLKSRLGVFWCSDSIQPIIEVKTISLEWISHPWTSHYLYVWDKDTSSYIFCGRKHSVRVRP